MKQDSVQRQQVYCPTSEHVEVIEFDASRPVGDQVDWCSRFFDKPNCSECCLKRCGSKEQ